MAMPDDLSLLTDLYQLTMAQAYFQSRRTGEATFSLFVRTYPQHRGYFVSAGLQDVLSYLSELRFDAAAIGYLRSKRLFADEFLDYLRTVRFTGAVWAIPEGRLFFKDEPILEVTAPIVEAQLVETFIINQIQLQSLIATKAARCVHAAGGRGVVDFSLRRTHGIDAGLKVARSSYLAGFNGTSNVLAGERYGLPIVGTMAHSYISSYEQEIDAFRSYVRSFPNHSILLIDTYDTIAGARKAVSVAKEMAVRGEKLLGVRIDSGDLLPLARQVREILDEAGLIDVKITGSGGLDEYDLHDFSQTNAAFDSYGVGTKMGTSADAPWCDMAYKLVEYDNRSVVKLSPGKRSWPGKKQVFRCVDSQGKLLGDVIGLREDVFADTEPLLRKFMEKGEMTTALSSLSETREVFLEEFARLPAPIKVIRKPENYPVEFSPRLQALRAEVERKVSTKT